MLQIAPAPVISVDHAAAPLVPQWQVIGPVLVIEQQSAPADGSLLAARFRHLDLAVLGCLRLRTLNSQHTICKRSHDVIGPEVTRQGHAILEIPDATGA